MGYTGNQYTRSVHVFHQYQGVRLLGIEHARVNISVYFRHIYNLQDLHIFMYVRNHSFSIYMGSNIYKIIHFKIYESKQVPVPSTQYFNQFQYLPVLLDLKGQDLRVFIVFLFKLYEKVGYVQPLAGQVHLL